MKDIPIAWTVLQIRQLVEAFTEAASRMKTSAITARGIRVPLNSVLNIPRLKLS
jgi:hypothetical protein